MSSIYDILHALFSRAAPPIVPPGTPMQPAEVKGILTVLPDAIKAVAPSLSDAEVQEWADALLDPMTKAGMTTPKRAAAFLGQLAEESNFKAIRENLNYQAARLVQVWPSRFPSIAAATPYAHNPEALANHVYCNRLGNGSEASGDGFKFRGGGAIQLTGRSTYAAFGATVGKSADDVATWITTPAGSAASACWFWTTRNINPLADAWDLESITKKINGGLTNLDQREEFSKEELAIFQGA